MHGRRLSLEHDLRPLRYTLEYGGLWLADACCGNEAFDKSFRKFAQELFPKDKLTRVPADANQSRWPLGRVINGREQLFLETAGKPFAPGRNRASRPW